MILLFKKLQLSNQAAETVPCDLDDQPHNMNNK